MAILRPFRALRPDPAHAAGVAAVPYDVVDRGEAAELARGNPMSFLHVSRPEIDLPAGTDPYAPEVYARAKESFERLARDLPLVREAGPSLYLYRLTWLGRAQTGIAGTFSLDEYDGGTIKKHEKTRKDKEDDRTRHVVALGAQTGPVFLAYRDLAAIDARVAEETRGGPLFDFTAADGIRHELWRARDPGALVGLFRDIPALYIADGHHRAASAARARTEFPGSEPARFFLAVAFPASQLRILPYYRVVKDLGGQSEDQFLEKLQGIFRLSDSVPSAPSRGEFSMNLGGRWLGLAPRSPAPAGASPIETLDVSRLQELVLGPVLGIADPRTDRRIDFVGGVRGTAELERRVASGEAAVAFSLHPTTIEDLMEVSDSGGIMPPKSTWFEPKLRDGLLIHTIAGDTR